MMLCGICARGGFEISMTWESGTPKKVIVSAREAGTTRLIQGERQKDLSLDKGQRLELEWE